jgi:PAS domain S-box-containing protein
LGQSLELLFPPALAESSMVLIRQTLTGQRWEVVEIKIQHRDCSERTVLWNSATLFAPDGRTPMATIAQGQDITTRKSAEEALRESEWRFRDMMAKVQLVSATLDPEGNITFANECLLQLTGWRPEEILGRNWFEVFVPTEAEVRQVLLQGVSEGRVPLAYENEILTRGGERRLIAWSNALLRDARGGIAGIAGIGVDITERKQAEKKMRETNAYLENLINYANAPIIVWDPQFRITRFNHAFESLTGCTEVEVLGKSLEFLFPPALAASSMELIRQTLTGQRWEVVEIRIQHRDGSERTVLWNSATLFAPDGQTPLATIAQGQDITERQQREAEVRELLQQTQRDAHTKAELLKEVNHRVKNNLLAILGIALAEQRQLSAEEKPVAQRFTGNLRRRIEGLLEVHQMLSASLWAPVPVNQLAQQIIQSVLAATPASCQVKLVLQPSTVKASPRQASNLALVFNELATNTVKYALAQRTAAQVTFAAAATESLIRLEYRDDGPGYPPEVLRQERLSVGLTLVRDLTTETLRGQLTLANEAGAVTVLEIKTEEINRT